MDKEKEFENIDSTNDETDQEDNLETTEEETSTEESDDVEALKEQNRKLFARAKKAEGFILKEGKWTKKEEKKKEEIQKPEPAIPADEEKIAKIISQTLEKRDLDSLELSDELKKEVHAYAKVKGISVVKALNSEYISFLKDKAEKKEKNEDASLGGNRKGTTKKNYKEMKSGDFDMSTPEGLAEFKKWEEYIKQELG